MRRMLKVEQLLSAQVINVDQLKQLTWNGISFGKAFKFKSAEISEQRLGECCSATRPPPLKTEWPLSLASDKSTKTTSKNTS